jgi:Flp pilus assembly protein TadG
MLREILSRLQRQQRGSVTIEVAIVAPVLLLLSLGGFDASTMVARQTELQSAAAEAAAIVQASPPTDEASRTTVRDVLKVSTGLTNDQVSVVEIYRCGTNTAYVTTNNCTTGQHVSKFIRATLNDRYSPVWTNFGIGGPVDYHVVRTVQIS